MIAVAAKAPAAAAAGLPPPASLVVLTGRPPAELAAALMRERMPHLAASAAEAIGVVGPLVRPGQTACLGCLDRTRADADPAWPADLAAQVTRCPAADAQAGCDAPLAAVRRRAGRRSQVAEPSSTPTQGPANADGERHAGAGPACLAMAAPVLAARIRTACTCAQSHGHG